MYMLFIAVFVAYTSFFSHAHFGEDNTGGRKAIQTETEKFRTQAVPTSIYRDEHGGYRLFIPARAVEVSETCPLFTNHVSCLSQLVPRHCSRIVRDWCIPLYGVLHYPDIYLVLLYSTILYYVLGIMAIRWCWHHQQHLLARAMRSIIFSIYICTTRLFHLQVLIYNIYIILRRVYVAFAHMSH